MGDNPAAAGATRPFWLQRWNRRTTLASLLPAGSPTAPTAPPDRQGHVADGGTVARGRAAGLDAADHLRRHDAYPFLAATGDLLMTGPTQTNVNDLIFVFVR
ncbi:MAG: MOFRL family protein [Caldilineaceae bacterium]